MPVPYRGRIELGRGGPHVEAEIDDLDATNWRGTALDAQPPPGRPEHGDLVVLLLDGARTGQSAPAQLEYQAARPPGTVLFGRRSFSHDVSGGAKSAH